MTALVHQGRAADRAEAAHRLVLLVFVSRDALRALHHAQFALPHPDIGRVGATLRPARLFGMVVPGPEHRHVDLELDLSAGTFTGRARQCPSPLPNRLSRNFEKSSPD